MVVFLKGLTLLPYRLRHMARIPGTGTWRVLGRLLGCRALLWVEALKIETPK